LLKFGNGFKTLRTCRREKKTGGWVWPTLPSARGFSGPATFSS